MFRFFQKLIFPAWPWSTCPRTIGCRPRPRATFSAATLVAPSVIRIGWFFFRKWSLFLSYFFCLFSATAEVTLARGWNRQKSTPTGFQPRTKHWLVIWLWLFTSKVWTRKTTSWTVKSWFARDVVLKSGSRSKVNLFFLFIREIKKSMLIFLDSKKTFFSDIFDYWENSQIIPTFSPCTMRSSLQLSETRTSSSFGTLFPKLDFFILNLQIQRLFHVPGSAHSDILRESVQRQTGHSFARQDALSPGTFFF